MSSIDVVVVFFRPLHIFVNPVKCFFTCKINVFRAGVGMAILIKLAFILVGGNV